MFLYDSFLKPLRIAGGRDKGLLIYLLEGRSHWQRLEVLRFITGLNRKRNSFAAARKLINFGPIYWRWHEVGMVRTGGNLEDSMAKRVLVAFGPFTERQNPGVLERHKRT